MLLFSFALLRNRPENNGFEIKDVKISGFSYLFETKFLYIVQPMILLL